MMRLQTLGELRIDGDRVVTLSSRRKELVLLAYLARRGPAPLNRAEAASLLWEDKDERRARQSLRQALLELRRLVGEGLSVEPEFVRLAGGAVELDATLFEAELRTGRHEAAVSRWKGDFLPGAEDVGGEEFRAWLEAERERLRQGLRVGLSHLIEDADARGAWREGISWAERWTRSLPLDQRAHVHLLRLLHLDGRGPEALAWYTGFQAQLRAAELEPSADLVQLGQLLERGTPSATRARGSSAALFTPDLVGRGPALAELSAVWHLARQGTSAVLLVEGELGIGKTRLCEEFMRRMEHRAGQFVACRVHAREGPGPGEPGSRRQDTERAQKPQKNSAPRDGPGARRSARYDRLA